MTITSWCWIGLFVGCGLLAFCGWCLVRGGSLRESGDMPALSKARKARGELRDGFCPVCGMAGVYLTKAGGPNRRYHICNPVTVQAHVWPPAPPEAL